MPSHRTSSSSSSSSCSPPHSVRSERHKHQKLLSHVSPPICVMMKRKVLHLLLPLLCCLQGHQVMLVAAAIFGQSFLSHLALVLSSLS